MFRNPRFNPLKAPAEPSTCFGALVLLLLIVLAELAALEAEAPAVEDALRVSFDDVAVAAFPDCAVGLLAVAVVLFEDNAKPFLKPLNKPPRVLL